MTARKILNSVGSNSLGYAVYVVANLLVSPIIVRSLGDNMYGAWGVVVSLIGYYGVFDVGIRSAVGHFVATYHARRDLDAVNRTLSTAMVLLTGVALLAAGVTLVGAHQLPSWYERVRDVLANTTLVDPDNKLAQAREPEALRTAIYVLGFGFALSFPMAIYGTVIYAVHRLGLQNAIAIPQTVLRVAFTVWVLTRGWGVVGLAVVIVATNALGWIASVVVAHRVLPGLSIALRHFAARSVRELYSYGGFNVLVNVGDTVLLYTSSIVIGTALGTKAVTWYGIGALLIPQYMGLIQAVTWSITPYFTACWATGNFAEVRRVLAASTRGVLALGAWVCGGLIFLGSGFLGVWQDPKYVSGELFPSSATILSILAVATLFRCAQSCGRQALFAMREVRYLGGLVLVEAALNVGLSLWFVRRFGLVGVAFATLLPVVFTQGVIQPLHLLRELEMDVGRYFLDFLRAIVPILLTMGAVHYALGGRLAITSWPTFLAHALVIATPALVVGLLAATTPDERRRLLRHFRRSPTAS
jgi:O-antigen/teichoic acid export membrane protein